MLNIILFKFGPFKAKHKFLLFMILPVIKSNEKYKLRINTQPPGLNRT